jgi:hypothetical protein
MNVMLAKPLGVIKQLFSFAVEYFLIVVQWKLKFLKVQLKKWKRCGAQKELDKAYAKLGGEVFALYKGGQTDLQGMPLVDQKLKLVEEAESGVFAVDEEIGAITSQYEEKKEAISSKYRMKRSGEGESGQE